MIVLRAKHSPRRLPAAALLALLTALVAGGISRPALAGHAAACWNRGLEMADHITAPTEGSDNAFFTRSGGAPPMGMMIFANSPSMLNLPGFRPGDVPVAERGCANSDFLNRRIWAAPDPLYKYDTATSSTASCTITVPTPTQGGRLYDNTFTYPRQDQGCYGGNEKSTIDDVKPNSYYVYRQWNDGGFGTGNDIATACGKLPDAIEAAACTTCLATSPYYIAPSVSGTRPYDMVLKGNFLHFYGPTYIGAYAAWKTTIMDNAKIIWGHGYFDADSGTAAKPGMKKGRDPNPACNKFNTDFNPANRGSYVNSFSPSGPPVATITQFPLAQALFSAGFFLTDSARFSDESTYVRTGTTAWSPQIGKNQDTICSPCQSSSTIVITDGLVSSDTVIHPDVKAMNVVTPIDQTGLNSVCTANLDCGKGLRCVAGVCVNKKGLPCAGPSDCGLGQQCVAGFCSNEWWADDVAKYFNTTDTRDTKCGIPATNPTPGQTCEPEKQSMSTYVINVGRAGNPALNNLAKMGGTESAYDATTGAEIRDALRNIVGDILRRATSFSVAAITTVQTRGTTFAFIPRFRPSTQTRWEGHLYRYKLFNEFAAGCTSADTGTTRPSDFRLRNPNADADCDDIYLKDRDNDFVGENDDGEFMKLDETQAYPWPVTDKPGVPVWDGADELAKRDLVNDPRVVQTVVDADGDGTFEPSEQIAFSTANVSVLMPYLALGGLNGRTCQVLAGAQGLTYASETDCAIDFVRFVIGHDVLDDDEDGDRNEPHAKILGDIFHSSPILVTPPVPKFLCDLGVSNQCLFSLYADKLTPKGDAGYKAYSSTVGKRDHFVLSGGNDGMVHAFHAGAYRTGDDPETPLVESSSAFYFDLGTGRELWSFIPPDMLPKLKRLLSEDRHNVFIDGTAMVRDVWVDSTLNPGEKDGAEYHTVAVLGERGGGRAYFGLDVTDPAIGRWRWGFPEVSSTYHLAMGQSWNDFAPNAPPIVPIAAADINGPLTIAGTKAKEQYVVFLGGGYDPTLVRGRSVSAVDAWTGAARWRFAQLDSTGSTDPREALFPVAAPVALLDLGAGPNFIGTQDGLFDTATVGDVGGQLWTFRFYEPGKDTGSDGLFDNWHGGRSFVQHKGLSLAKRSPFFQLASATVLLEGGAVRAYVGTGDRANIRDAGAGECGLSNLIGCVRNECSVDVNLNDNREGTQYARGRWAYTAGASSLAANTFGLDSANRESSCSDTVDVNYNVSIDCGTGSTVQPADPPFSSATSPYRFRASCDWGATTAGVDCPGLNPDPDFADTGPTYRKPEHTRITKTVTSENARYYAVKLFSATGARVPFRTRAEAAAYDLASLSDVDLVNGDTTLSTSSDNGYYVRYPEQAERTASGTGLLGGCVIWNTLTPDATSLACGGTIGDIARLYRAHYITGATSCGNVDGSTVPPRSVTRRSIVPPPPPTPVVALNPLSGEVRYSVVSIEPGAAPSQTSVGQSDIQGLIHWIDVPRPVHDCRHGAGKCPNQ